MKAAIVVLSDPKSNTEESLGRVFNALASAYDFQQDGQEVTVLFSGAGTRWIAELTKIDHPAHDLLRRLRIKGAFKFTLQQPMVILGSVDEKQNVWASILLGHPGFIRAIDPQTVELDLKQAFKYSGDRFWKNIHDENRIGMLFIELATRRRLRINGAIAQNTSDKLSLQVLESYPNCPKYIQRRHLSFKLDRDSQQPSQARSGQILTNQQQRWIELADTFFVASFHSIRGVDISHRGGNPGFIQIIDRQTLRIPDYNGNGMFNTLGNLIINPRAGLIFIDFERSRTLQLSGRATILWD